MIELNQQPPEKATHTDGFSLDVIRVFDTIQGEGPFTGVPAVFVRLAGCNLQCPNCDTDYTTHRQLVSVREIIQVVASFKRQLVVLTGGEPFRQNLGPLVDGLFALGKVQIETNGTLFPTADDFPWYTGSGDLTVVCSPKTPLIHPKLQRHVKHLKYVLSAMAVDEKDGLPIVTLGAVKPARPWPGFDGTVWVQPEDQGDEVLNKHNLAACVRSSMMFNYRVSTQTHKLMGVP